MDQKDAQDPRTPPPNTGGGERAPIDLGKILLPKKVLPGNNPDTAQRVNAGALFEQEQNATLVPKKPVPQKPSGLPSGAPSGPAAQTSAPQVSPANVQKEKEEPMIAPLQTYKGDIESLIQNTNASTVSIAAAEAARRSQQPLNEGAAVSTDWGAVFKRAGFVAGGVALLIGAAGLIYVVYQHLNATVAIPEAPPAPFIAVDVTTPITLSGELQRTTLVDSLTTAQEQSTLSLGLIERFALYQPAASEDAPPALLDSRTLLPLLAPNMPEDLVRTLTGTYLLGLHAYDGLQPFLIFETDSYEHAFAGMLQWERAMRGDLLPLFNREPRPRLPEEGIATSSVGDVPQVIQTGFSDKIVENRDARVILNTAGDILLMWLPLTQHVFVVTTNEYTLREIISRLGL